MQMWPTKGFGEDASMHAATHKYTVNLINKGINK